MSKLLKEIKYDVRYLKSHTHQPKWFKMLKVFLILGFLAGYCWLFGFIKSVIFLIVFVSLMLVVHFIYRGKTNKYTQSWLDFVIEETPDGIKGKSIGVFYYSSIVLNTIIAIICSQAIAGLFY